MLEEQTSTKFTATIPCCAVHFEMEVMMIQQTGHQEWIPETVDGEDILISYKIMLN